MVELNHKTYNQYARVVMISSGFKIAFKIRVSEGICYILFHVLDNPC